MKIVIPKPPSVGPKKTGLDKVREQALLDAVASSTIIGDDWSWPSVSNKVKIKILIVPMGKIIAE
jgi:hypothetical protein